MAWFWRCKPDKDSAVSFISHRSFKANQVNLIEMRWTDVKNTDSSPKWYLKPLSWCGTDLHKSICSYLVFSRLQRIILICSVIFHAITPAYDKYSHFLWFVRNDPSILSITVGLVVGLDEWTSFTRDTKLIRNGPFILSSKKEISDR